LHVANLSIKTVGTGSDQGNDGNVTSCLYHLLLGTLESTWDSFWYLDIGDDADGRMRIDWVKEIKSTRAINPDEERAVAKGRALAIVIFVSAGHN
jgi:hypothetical protein